MKNVLVRSPLLRKVRVGVLACTLGLVGVGLSLVESSPASAANVTFSQCNGINDTPGLTTTCSVVVVNNLTNNPATTGSVVTVNGGLPTTSSSLVNSVLQCNNSGNGGGAVMTCNVTVTNNIAVNGAVAATGATINQCFTSGGPPGNVLGPPLPGNPDPCDPYPASTTGATITQCDSSAAGGGLVAPSTCDASGTVSSSLPVTVNQCNNSVNGGGSKINCSTTMTTNVINTTPGTSGGTGGGGGGASVTGVGSTTGGGTGGGTTGTGTTGTGTTAGPAATTALAQSSGALAFTGFNLAPLLVAGIGLIAGGALLLGATETRRKRAAKMNKAALAHWV